MITSAILLMIYWVASNVVALLPDSPGLPDNTVSGFQTVFSYLSPFSFIVDFQVLLSLIAASIVLEGGIIVWAIINWTLKKVPGVQ